MQDGILIVGEFEVEGALQDIAVDPRNIEKIEKVAQMFARLFAANSLGCNVMDRCDSGRRNEPLDSAAVDEGEEPGCNVGMRFSGQENVENDVRIEENLHLCLRSRWAR